jgi:hypothetical protein
VSFLFAGSIEHLMRDLFAAEERALSQFGSFHPLPPIPAEAWQAGIEERLAADGCTIEPEGLERLVAAGEGHPRTTVLIARWTHEAAVVEGTSRRSIGFVSSAGMPSASRYGSQAAAPCTRDSTRRSPTTRCERCATPASSSRTRREAGVSPTRYCAISCSSLIQVGDAGQSRGRRLIAEEFDLIWPKAAEMVDWVAGATRPQEPFGQGSDSAPGEARDDLLTLGRRDPTRGEEMFRKLLVVGLAVCSLIAAEAASGESSRGLMKGRTAQGRAIHLAQRGKRVKIRHFSIQLRCSDGSVLVDLESGFVPTRVGRNGRVHDHQFGSTDEVWVRGRLRGRRLRGTVRVRDRWGSARCDSRWVRFHATRIGG